MFTELLYAGIGVLAIYQLYVTLRVLAAAQYSRAQKVAQVAFVWFIPFIAAIVCHIFLLSDSQSPPGKDTAFLSDGGDNPPGIGTDGIHH